MMFWERGRCTENHIYCSCLKDRDDQIDAVLVAARTVVELWDRWMATASPDRPSIRDLDAAIDALRPSSVPWYADR